MEGDAVIIGAVCCTYRRPELLANAVACFEAQTYPNRRLLILDDGHTLTNQEGDRWAVVSLSHRVIEGLWFKRNLCAKYLVERFPEVDALCCWDDDDVFLPNHLERMAQSLEVNDFTACSAVHSTYQQPFGRVMTESGFGRFESSWGYRRELFEMVRGWPADNEHPANDQLFGQRMEAAMDRNRGDSTPDGVPTYVYRWHGGNCSAHMGRDDWYRGQEQRLNDDRYVGELEPRFDAETLAIFKQLGISCGRTESRPASPRRHPAPALAGPVQ